MARTFGIIGTACMLMLLSGCGEELTAEAKKAADQIAAEATKTATKKIDELKNDTLSQLKQMQGEEKNKGEGGEKSEKKSD
ncbi:MAG TPA: hypothetical protein VFK88_08385 [Gallionella sp.]|nr:hypothetical protein [Gallionella sp.]